MHDLAGDRVDLTLLDAQHNFVYRPLLVADLFLRDRAGHVSMAEVARDTGARLVPDAVATVVDRDRVVVTQGGERLRYDALLLATGATSVTAYRVLTGTSATATSGSPACSRTSRRAACGGWRSSSRTGRAGRCPPTNSR